MPKDLVLSTLALGFMLVAALSPSVALSDECASYGPEAWMSNPHNGSKIAMNARFRIEVAPSCGGIEGGPPHQFRLVNAKGAELESSQKVIAENKNCKPVPCQTIALIPGRPLEGGTVVVEVKKPMEGGKLGPWETLARYEAAGWVDKSAPQFDGIADTQVSVIVGSAPISPCQAEPAWEISARFLFELAHDGDSNPDDLLYALDGKAAGQSEWIELLSFRPNIDEKTGRGFYEWHNQKEWGQSFDFRLRVKDAAGYETVGLKTVSLVFPAKPGGQPRAEQAKGDDRVVREADKAMGVPSAQDGLRGRGGCAGCEAAREVKNTGLGWLSLLLIMAMGRRKAF